MSLLDGVIPTWDVRTRQSVEIDASPERVWRAVEESTLGEMRIARLLFRVRGLQSAAERTLLDLEGFARLADEPQRELVVGAVGRPWRLRGGLLPEANPASFTTPGFARMAINVTLAGKTLATETRVACTDATARRRFRVYWLVVKPFSELVRRDWLRAIKRRAEGD